MQFYDDDAFLASSVADFLEAGLRLGRPCQVIAEPAHAASIAAALGRRRLPPEVRPVSYLDARTTLGTFMVGSVPDPALFHDSLVPVISGLLTEASPGPVHLYGEMVDVLWRDGMSGASIRLEELWNDLASKYALSLLCAYAMDNFCRDDHRHHFDDVCRRHAVVLPTEKVARTPGGAGLWREVARLEQRARSYDGAADRRDELAATIDATTRARDEFFDIASHELRNPVHAIQLQLLGAMRALDLSDGPEAAEAARRRVMRAQAQVERLGTLLDRLLHCSVLDAEDRELNVDDIDLADVVRLVLEAHRLPLSSVAVHQKLTPTIGRWDRLRVEQVVTHLVSNAIRFGQGRPITLALDGDWRNAVLSIADQGIGVSVAHPTLRFSRRTSNADSDSGVRRLGPGLWMTSRIVDLLGGTIELESTVGAGTVFTVTLPRSPRS